jgi:hypothetical protein
MGMMCIVDARWHVNYWAHALDLARQRKVCLYWSASRHRLIAAAYDRLKGVIRYDAFEISEQTEI